VSGGVSDVDANTMRRQTLCHRRLFFIRAGHHVAEIGEQLGDSVHAASTNANEVNPAGLT
jgi:hypothetical protein